MAENTKTHESTESDFSINSRRVTLRYTPSLRTVDHYFDTHDECTEFISRGEYTRSNPLYHYMTFHSDGQTTISMFDVEE